MHSDYLFKDKSHPFHHDSEERIEIFACSHHFVQPIVHFLRIKFLMEISNSPSKAHLPPKKGISGNKNLSNMQGYIYTKIYSRLYYLGLHQTRYFISFMYDRFYDLYYITRLNVRLVNYLRISPPFIRGSIHR